MLNMSSLFLFFVFVFFSVKVRPILSNMEHTEPREWLASKGLLAMPICILSFLEIHI